MRLRMHRKGKRTFASACYCPRTNLFCFTLLRPTPQQHSHMVTCRNLDTTDTLHTKALLAVPNHRIIRYPSGSAMNAPVPAKAKQTHFRASCAHVATTASPLHAHHRNSIGTCSVPESRTSQIHCIQNCSALSYSSNRNGTPCISATSASAPTGNKQTHFLNELAGPVDAAPSSSPFHTQHRNSTSTWSLSGTSTAQIYCMQNCSAAFLIIES